MYKGGVMWRSHLHLLEKAFYAASGWGSNLRQMSFTKEWKAVNLSEFKKIKFLEHLYTVEIRLHSFWIVLYEIRNIIWIDVSSFTFSSCPWRKSVYVHVNTDVTVFLFYSLNLISFLAGIADMDTYSSYSCQHPVLLCVHSGCWSNLQNPQPTIRLLLDHGKARDRPSILLSLPPDYLHCSATQVSCCYIIIDYCCYQN